MVGDFHRYNPSHASLTIDVKDLSDAVDVKDLEGCMPWGSDESEDMRKKKDALGRPFLSQPRRVGVRAGRGAYWSLYSEIGCTVCPYPPLP